VLPGAAFAEKRGSMVNLSGRLQRLNRAIEPPLHARDDWEMIRDIIAAHTGEMVGIHLIEDLFKQIAATVPAFQGLTLSRIGHQGTVVLETDHKIPLLENERARKASGLING
jgi:NADH-quinone oxidoreductase subunit G